MDFVLGLVWKIDAALREALPGLGAYARLCGRVQLFPHLPVVLVSPSISKQQYFEMIPLSHLADTSCKK